MCILCHYRGDNQLVTPQCRLDDHGDGRSECIRPIQGGKTWCTDCQKVVISTALIRHICDGAEDRYGNSRLASGGGNRRQGRKP
jgi:hypothetical protein